VASFIEIPHAKKSVNGDGHPDGRLEHINASPPDAGDGAEKSSIITGNHINNEYEDMSTCQIIGQIQ